MLVSQTNPVGVGLFSYANAFFCFNKLDAGHVSENTLQAICTMASFYLLPELLRTLFSFANQGFCYLNLTGITNLTLKEKKLKYFKRKNNQFNCRLSTCSMKTRCHTRADGLIPGSLKRSPRIHKTTPPRIRRPRKRP